MFRLVGIVGERRVAFLLREGRNVVGSAAGCAVQIEHPSVSRRHAELVVRDVVVDLVDLRSRNGTFVEGERVHERALPVGALLAFGRVSLALEQIAAGDATSGIALPAAAAPAPPLEERAGSTVGTRALDVFAAERLPALLELVREGAGETRVAAAAGGALFDTLPAQLVEIARGEAVLFRAARELPEPSGAGKLVCALGALEVRVVLLSPGAARLLRPLVESAASLVALAADRAPATPPAAPSAAPPPPDPPSVVPAVQRIFAEAARAARGEVSVLIGGESGTGKEVLARYIHAASPRAGKPFVALNCAALARDLLEAELFGIERGVATGVDARPGKFELADGGTLFLDEIGDMAKETQARILRALQEGHVFRVGGSVPRPARVRIVAATNRDLAALQQGGEFRSDLYYRIATWVVEMPPLRRRKGDIGNLAVFFLAREAARAGVRVAGISRAALDLLFAHPWPGNVRQLEKEMARAVLFLEGRELLDSAALSAPLREPPSASAAGGGLKQALLDAERREILRALEACSGEVGEAATMLGLGRSTLYRRLKELGIPAPK